MGIRKVTERKLREAPRRLYGFVDSIVDALDDRPHSRVSVLLDAVDADEFDRDRDAIADDASLYLVRVITTRNRLEELIGSVPSETDWLSLHLDRVRNTPAAWVVPSGDGGFGNPLRTNLVELGRLTDPGDERLALLKAACISEDTVRAESPDPAQFAIILHPDTKFKVEALDVGQASCVAFYSGSKCLGYFDVGAPISFNGKSFPKRFSHQPSPDGFVLLSHWDFDHYALAYKHPVLQTLKWYAPDQPVGPRTSKFQKSLGAKLEFISGGISLGGVELARCTGPASDRNASGYALRLNMKDQAVLLTGDADYDAIPASLLPGLTAVLVPHHGGKGIALPPKPLANSDAIAVASYGLPNRYRHPCETRLSDHQARGWKIKRTAKFGRGPAIPRGTRRLYPLP